MGLNGNNFLKQIEKRLDFNSFTIIMWSVYLAVITNHISRIIKNERSKYRISKRMLQTIPFMIWIFIKNWYFRIYKVNLCCLEWWNQFIYHFFLDKNFLPFHRHVGITQMTPGVEQKNHVFLMFFILFQTKLVFYLIFFIFFYESCSSNSYVMVVRHDWFWHFTLEWNLNEVLKMVLFETWQKYNMLKVYYSSIRNWGEIYFNWYHERHLPKIKVCRR